MAASARNTFLRIATCVILLLTAGTVAAQSGRQSLTFVVGDCRFDMVYVQGGSFMMGCESKNWHIGKTDEVPIHGVSLSNYYL